MAFAYYIPAVFISGRVIKKTINHYVSIACEIREIVSHLYIVKQKCTLL